ncbi:MAG: hypothetical protein IJD91_00230 [Clostridia bacterium]|nr:hypothetical protein [Clostridia bacterium]
MKKVSVLKVADKKERTRDLIKYLDRGMYDLVIAKNSKRAIKKIAKMSKGQIIAINNNSKELISQKGGVRKYSELSNECVLAVIEKTCREIAVKYGFQLPLEDLYIYAPTSKAYEYVEKLIGLSRIFTIVSDEPPGEVADSLYFEFGCLLRHVRKSELKICDETISIFLDENGVVNSPIINISKREFREKQTIDIGRIAVCDNEVKEIAQDLSCVSGLVLCTLFGKVPGKDANVDINKTADSIFVLDTKGI